MISRRGFLAALAAAGPAATLHPRSGRGSGRAGAASPPSGPRRQATAHALVLGTAQDGGMPQAGCYSERCERARGEDPRYVTSLALVEPGSASGDSPRFYLVDASPDLRQQIDLIPEDAFRRRASERRPFDGIFLTHAHIGHYLGLALLGREGLGIAPTACYCSEPMRRFLTNNGPWSLLVREGRLHFPDIEPDQWTAVGPSLRARMLPVPHRPEFSDTVGFQFAGGAGTLLYLPDIDSWDAWDRKIEDVVGESDVSLLDGAFWSPDEVPGRRVEDIPHPMIPDTMRRLEPQVAAGRTVVFTHLNNTNPVLDRASPEAARIRDAGFHVAREGMTFPL